MDYNDELSLKDFFFVHRLVHTAVDGYIAQNGGSSMPNSTLDTDAAMHTWIKKMAQVETSETDDRALTDWLQLHSNLHLAENAALNLSTSPDLSVVDFSDKTQFNDWMYEHALLHDALNSAAGQN
jgi:hypothetical protein